MHWTIQMLFVITTMSHRITDPLPLPTPTRSISLSIPSNDKLLTKHSMLISFTQTHTHMFTLAGTHTHTPALSTLQLQQHSDCHHHRSSARGIECVCAWERHCCYCKCRNRRRSSNQLIIIVGNMWIIADSFTLRPIYHRYSLASNDMCVPVSASIIWRISNSPATSGIRSKHVQSCNKFSLPTAWHQIQPNCTNLTATLLSLHSVISIITMINNCWLTTVQHCNL
jgi:hypothetical protein